MNNNNNKNTVSRPVKTAGYNFAKQRARRDKRRVEAEQRAAKPGEWNYRAKQILTHV